MPSIYAISYTKGKNLLMVTCKNLPNHQNQLFFNNFVNNLRKIIVDSHETPVVFSAVSNRGEFLYTDDISCNERITDVLFLYGQYRHYTNHYSDLLTKEEFSCWQSVIKDVDKLAALEMLYKDDKISRAYFFKRALNFANVFFGRPAEQENDSNAIEKTQQLSNAMR